MKHKILLALFLCVVIVFSANIVSMESNEIVEVKKVISSLDSFSIGNINEANDVLKIDIYYPITKYENVNVEIMKRLQDYISRVKESEYVSDNKFLKISFEDFKSGDIISFKFNVEYNEGLYHNSEEIFTIVFDDNGILDTKCINNIINEQETEKLKDIEINNFVLNENKVIIFVDNVDKLGNNGNKTVLEIKMKE